MNTTTPNIKFNASLVMSSINGIDSHRHRITDFMISNVTFLPRNVIINGTASLTTTGDKAALDNNLLDIPIRIQIPNLKTIIIEIDNKMAKEHFGDTPIYGKVD